MFRFRRTAATACAAVILAACGGGGGSDGNSGGNSGGNGSAAVTNQPPVAAARLTGEAVLQATTVFDTTGTLDPEGRPLTRSWDYGDGRSGSTDSHIYTSTGSFTAVYTVRDDQGASTSKPVPVVVAKCSADGTRAVTLSPYPAVCMQTSQGEIVLEVYPARAPRTAANFLKYVDDGFYAGTLFHRVIAGFVVQGGGFTTGLVAKAATDAPIPLESSNDLQNLQYTLAMARTSVPDSATSQFFINLVDNHFLDYSAAIGAPNGYAVFGQVIAGTAVVDALGRLETGTVGGMADVPLQDVVVRSAVRMP